MTDRDDPASIPCSTCGCEVEECFVCDEDDCAVALCYGCMREVVMPSPSPLHARGG